MMNVWKGMFLRWRYPSNWLENIRQIPRSIRWSYQRITRGFADVDVFNLDCYLSGVIIGTLNHLADHHFGVPYSLKDSPDEWTAWLRETANKFEEANKIEEDSYSVEFEQVKAEHDKAAGLRKEGLERLSEYWGCLWD